jgi:pimeloyl-ACP methyl ester carboxylesterase
MADVEHTLDRLGVGPVVLLGHSMGARVCIPLAVRMGPRCLGLIIEDMDVRPRRERAATARQLDKLRAFRQRQPDKEGAYAELEKFGYERRRTAPWIENTPGRVFPYEGEGGGWFIGIHPLASHTEVGTLLATTDAREALPRLREGIER